jgi:flagellar biosynthesis protein FliQ
MFLPKIILIFAKLSIEIVFISRPIERIMTETKNKEAYS